MTPQKRKDIKIGFFLTVGIFLLICIALSVFVWIPKHEKMQNWAQSSISY